MQNITSNLETLWMEKRNITKFKTNKWQFRKRSLAENWWSLWKSTDEQSTASELYQCRKNCWSFSQFSDSKLQISAKFRAHFVHKAKLQNLRMKVDSILIFQNQHAIKSTVKWWPFLGALARDSKINFLI